METERVLEAIGRLQEHISDDRANAHIDILRRELQEMSAAIVQTRREIASIRPDSGGGPNRIMAATEELDAIVTATERATTDILSCAEKLTSLMTDMRARGADPSDCETIENITTEIFLACSFQDITGQRTTKVVNVLRYLEQRVNSMIEIWGIEKEDEDRASPLKKSDDARPDAHLLNGPQLEGQGVSQEDVDAMFGGPTGQASQDDIDSLFP
ncbi:MAG: protein phosphatase CheZ [Alphaproteobacteria bacterium]|nr:protein phosphatase CheZ [Alphaproteobacteria bacterium]